MAKNPEGTSTIIGLCFTFET